GVRRRPASRPHGSPDSGSTITRFPPRRARCERWIYGVPPILTASAQGSLEAVSALRVVEVAEGRVVRVLGEQRIDGQSGEESVVPVETTESLIGVVGDGRAGLSAF
ncbi:MAG: hypothetical protein ACKORL_03425, partial [Phycisphaerales bacterium]